MCGCCGVGTEMISYCTICLVYSAASIVARYFSMFPAPSSHCQKSSPEPWGMSELVVVAATTGAAARVIRAGRRTKQVWHLGLAFEDHGF